MKTCLARRQVATVSTKTDSDNLNMEQEGYGMAHDAGDMAHELAAAQA